MSLVVDEVLVRQDPTWRPAPVVIENPYGGTHYPDGFEPCCPVYRLRGLEDPHLDELLTPALDHGATLVSALFPRSFVDVNRAADDLDPGLLDGAWPLGPLAPSPTGRRGLGVLHAVCAPGVPLYDGRLPVAQAVERIDRYWRPYHLELAATLEDLRLAAGFVWHVSVRSVSALATVPDDHPPLDPDVDVVLGAIPEGPAADPDLAGIVADCLGALGYTVALAGGLGSSKVVEPLRRPMRTTRSGYAGVQVALARRLYMDEETHERTRGFERVQEDLSLLAALLCRRAEALVSGTAVEATGTVVELPLRDRRAAA